MLVQDVLLDVDGGVVLDVILEGGCKGEVLLRLVGGAVLGWLRSCSEAPDLNLFFALGLNL